MIGLLKHDAARAGGGGGDLCVHSSIKNYM